jgi:dTDP-4-dehydrorhamnose 3,5-epimerase-like enzyme
MDQAKKGTWQIVNLNSKGDARGELVAINGSIDIPFAIKRIYYMTSTLTDVVRGLHAHKQLEQVLIAVKGSVSIKVTDGFKEEVIRLDNHVTGLKICNLVWREIYDFSPDCVVLTLASEVYNENDYIRDFSDFMQFATKVNI